MRKNLCQLNRNEKERISSLDLVRLFACICITIVHFNASVSGYNSTFAFTYPNSVTPNFFLENRLYLGDIGVCLFFILSGASMMLTYQGGNLKQYYKKRFLGLFPMFWLAYCVAFVFDFLHNKGMGYGNTGLLFFSAIGMDGYLAALGLIPGHFFKVAEWFLGCILLLYMIFPILHYCLEKKPGITLFAVCALYILYMFYMLSRGLWPNTIFFLLRIPELLTGMLFTKYNLRKKPKMMLSLFGISAWLAIVLRKLITPMTLCTAVCSFLFALIVWFGEKITSNKIKSFLCKASALTYPIFVIHHWIINRLIIGFDLANMAKRDVVMLFIIYVVLTVFLAHLLKIYSSKIVAYLKRFVQHRSGCAVDC